MAIQTAWSTGNCESGDGKGFGPCEADGGVILQERAGEAVLLAVAFDVAVVGRDGESELTVVIEVGGRAPRHHGTNTRSRNEEELRRYKHDTLPIAETWNLNAYGRGSVVHK